MRLKTLLQLSLLTSVLGFLAWSNINSLVFFTCDTGLRFLQIISLIENNWQTLAITYPGQSIDPQFKYVPYYYAYSIVNDNVFLNISPFFPILASLLYANIDIIGLAVSPILGTLLTAYAMQKLVTQIKLPFPWVAAWLTVFSTPLLFYSLELWDHSLGVGCATWAVYWTVTGLIYNRTRLLIFGGVALGVGLGQRPEIYSFALAIGIATTIHSWPRIKQVSALVGGTIVGAIPFWIMQYVWVRHPLGMAFAPHFFGHGRKEDYLARLVSSGPITSIERRLNFLLDISNVPIATFSSVLILLGFVVILRQLQGKASCQFLSFRLGLTYMLAGYTLWAFLGWKMFLNGLIPSLPCLALVFILLPSRNEPNQCQKTAYQLLKMTALFFFLLMVAFWPGYGGLQWGARYLLPLYPILFFLGYYLCWLNLVNHKRDLIFYRYLSLVLCLLVASVGFQVISIRLLYTSQSDPLMLRKRIATIPARFIITTDPVLPSHMSSIRDKAFFFITDADQLLYLVSQLRGTSVPAIGLLISPRYPIAIPKMIKETALTEIENNVYLIELSHGRKD